MRVFPYPISVSDFCCQKVLRYQQFTAKANQKKGKTKNITKEREKKKKNIWISVTDSVLCEWCEIKIFFSVLVLRLRWQQNINCSTSFLSRTNWHTATTPPNHWNKREEIQGKKKENQTLIRSQKNTIQ